MKTRWSVAVFAHNEAAGIADCLRSIMACAHGQALDIVVIANGCRDGTADIVRNLAPESGRIRVVEISLGDKANAWNHYVHVVTARDVSCQPAMHVFVDGDVRVEPGALATLAATFNQTHAANAVGAFPATGRDRVAWSGRMAANGTLAGGLYALRGEFVDRIRQRAIRIPRGMIGEDWLVSLLAKTDLNPVWNNMAHPQCVVFAPGAGFSFRSLNPWSMRDAASYARRLWRYALRGVQYEMVYGLLLHDPPETLPPDIEQVYNMALPPSRLKWIGPTSLLRFMAVQKVRNMRAGNAGRKPRSSEANQP